MKWKAQGTFVLALLLAAGCKSEAVKTCNKLVSSSEVTLLSMNPSDEASVTATLAALNETLKACEAAKSPEVPEIKKGVANVEEHLARLKQGKIKPLPPPPTAESLAELEKNGDPECPAGQAYRHPATKKQIRCSGPRMIQHSYAQVIHYFKKHHIPTAIKETMIRGTQAGVTYTFKFKSTEGSDGPVCLTIEAGKDQKEGDLIAFATGRPPQEVDAKAPLTIEGHEVLVKVVPGAQGKSVTLGDCDKQEAMLPSSPQP